ncbi:hypothetical protein GF377_03440, partial [candidate division GN15 bacterium]|nr:hypothetical protein [candidate division GN15 bacterium]
MKQTLFVTLNAIVAFGIGFGLWYGVFRTSENPIVHSIYQGGPLVVLLIMIFVMCLVFAIERYISLYGNAKGKSSV